MSHESVHPRCVRHHETPAIRVWLDLDTGREATLSAPLGDRWVCE